MNQSGKEDIDKDEEAIRGWRVGL